MVAVDPEGIAIPGKFEEKRNAHIDSSAPSNTSFVPRREKISGFRTEVHRVTPKLIDGVAALKDRVILHRLRVHRPLGASDVVRSHLKSG